MKSLLSSLFVVLIMQPAFSQSEISQEKADSYGVFFEKGYMALTNRTYSKGKLTSAKCKLVDYDKVRCLLKYDGGADHGFISIFDVTVSYLDGTLGEEVYKLHHTSVLK